MKLQFFLAWAAAGVLGGIFHFVYVWFPFPLVGLFFPINESVWEHLKLLYWPVILAGAGLSHWAGRRVWSGILTAVLTMPPALLGAYYALVYGFAVTGEWLPILLYYVVLAGGFFLAYRMTVRGAAQARLGELVMLAGVYAEALVLFSIAAPNLPIFISA